MKTDREILRELAHAYAEAAAMPEQKETARIWEQEKRTVIFVTNNIDEALFLGDRIVLMEGKLPGTIKTEYQIDLPRPREHTSMELLKLRSVITDNTALVL